MLFILRGSSQAEKRQSFRLSQPDRQSARQPGSNINWPTERQRERERELNSVTNCHKLTQWVGLEPRQCCCWNNLIIKSNCWAPTKIRAWPCAWLQTTRSYLIRTFNQRTAQAFPKQYSLLSLSHMARIRNVIASHIQTHTLCIQLVHLVW